jgi:hypothetical protein
MAATTPRWLHGDCLLPVIFAGGCGREKSALCVTEARDPGFRWRAEAARFSVVGLTELQCRPRDPDAESSRNEGDVKTRLMTTPPGTRSSRTSVILSAASMTSPVASAISSPASTSVSPLWREPALKATPIQIGCLAAVGATWCLPQVSEK